MRSKNGTAGTIACNHKHIHIHWHAAVPIKWDFMRFEILLFYKFPANSEEMPAKDESGHIAAIAAPIACIAIVTISIIIIRVLLKRRGLWVHTSL